MTKEASQTVVPELRFPEFREAAEWLEMSVGELLKVRQEKQVPTNEVPLYSLTIESGVTAKSDRYNREFLVREPESKKYKLVKPNDIVYNPSNLRWGAINYSRLSHSVVVSPIYEVLYVADYAETCLEFVAQALMRQEQIRSFISKAQGTLVERIAVKIDSFLETPVSVPQTFAEQQKIADALSSIDALITAQSAKLQALQTHKRSLMQALFPAEGETVPKLRFPEFEEEWQKKPLGELGNVLMCKRIFAEETNSVTGIPFFKIGTLGGKPDAFISRELFEEYKAKYNYPKKGEVLITCSGTVGKCLTYDGEEAYYQDSNIVWIDNPALEVSNELLYNLLVGINWGALNSTTITRIYGADLRALSIAFPESKEEQRKIAATLSSLDALITAQREQIDALKRHKKGLMQGLFPAAPAPA